MKKQVPFIGKKFYHGRSLIVFVASPLTSETTFQGTGEQISHWS